MIFMEHIKILFMNTNIKLEVLCERAGQDFTAALLMFFGSPARSLHNLHYIQNSAAIILMTVKKHHHITHNPSQTSQATALPWERVWNSSPELRMCLWSADAVDLMCYIYLGVFVFSLNHKINLQKMDWIKGMMAEFHLAAVESGSWCWASWLIITLSWLGNRAVEVLYYYSTFTTIC